MNVLNCAIFTLRYGYYGDINNSPMPKMTSGDCGPTKKNEHKVVHTLWCNFVITKLIQCNREFQGHKQFQSTAFASLLSVSPSSSLCAFDEDETLVCPVRVWAKLNDPSQTSNPLGCRVVGVTNVPSIRKQQCHNSCCTCAPSLTQYRITAVKITSNIPLLWQKACGYFLIKRPHSYMCVRFGYICKCYL